MDRLLTHLDALGIIASLTGSLAVLAFAASFPYFDAALKEPGPDRERLRLAMALGGQLRALYVRLVTALLDRLDYAIGDKGRGASSLRSPFGNRLRHPYWTGWSFEACALFGIAYPFLSIAAIWVLTGDSPPMTYRVGLVPWAGWVDRAIIGIVTLALLPVADRALSGRPAAMVLGLAAGAAGVAAAQATGIGAYSGMAPVAGLIVALVRIRRYLGFVREGHGLLLFVALLAIFIGLTVWESVFELGRATLLMNLPAGIIAGVLFFVFLTLLEMLVLNRGYGPRAYWGFGWPLLLVATYALIAAQAVLDRLEWTPVLVLAVLVPLVNLPVDWLSLGLTRALMRRSTEPAAPSPALLGLLDLVLALLLIPLLGGMLILALLLVSAIGVALTGNVLLELRGGLAHLAERPVVPSDVWIYITLFSTLIPSIVNILLGAVSLVAWSAPFLRRLVLRELDRIESGPAEGQAAARYLLATLLSAQIALGVLLTGLMVWLLWQALAHAQPLLAWLHWAAIEWAELLAWLLGLPDPPDLKGPPPVSI